MRHIVSIASISLAVAACSSSSSSTATADCFNGNYAITYGPESTGGPNCPDLTSLTGQAVYVVGADGKVTATVVQGATPTPGGTFDENACHATYGFTKPNGDSSCADPEDHYTFDLAFDRGKSFTGTYHFVGCGTTGDAGPTVNVDCTYPVTGTAK